MILELLLRRVIDPNPVETRAARLRAFQGLAAALRIKDAVANAQRAQEPDAGAPAPKWTREQPTMNLRFHDGALQQRWIVSDMAGRSETARRDEWRDVPSEETPHA